MRTLLQAPAGGAAAGAVGSAGNTLATPGSSLLPPSSSPPTDTSSSSSTSTPPPSSPSSAPSPPSPSLEPPPPSPSEPPPSPPAAAPPPPTPAASPPPPEASPPPSPAELPPPPPAPVPTATTSPPPPPAVAPPPPSSTQAPPPPPPPSAPPPRRSHATPPTSSSSPPPPAAAEPTASAVAATPPHAAAAHPVADHAPPTPARTTSSTTATHSPAAIDNGVTTPPPSGSSGLSSGATAAVAVVVVLVVVAFAGAFVCLSTRRRRKHQADRYYAGFAAPSYTPQHLSGEAPFLRPPPSSAPGSMNFSMGGGMSAPPPPMSQGYGGYGQQQQQQQWAPASGNYTSGSQGGPARSVASAASGDLSVGNTKAFSFDELYEITGGFARENVLGEGGFGCVFKGTLADGKVVAVKQLKGGGGQGEREFQAEVEIISRVHHRHLVSLVGYCIAEDHRLLVYDYVSNDTLHHHLHGRGRPVMDWPTRVKIAAGSARGLAYLHEDCHPRIIHRDIKSSNILLDDQFEAQVADFGLARLAENDVTHISTRVMGTFGYLALEYASTGKLTEKSDVFSFGVVLLELITGRKPVDSSRPLGDESLVEWSRPLLNRAIENQEFDELVDPRLDGDFDDVEMFRVIGAAAACIRHSAARRPKMGQVVRVLDSLTDVDLSNGVQPGKSQMFNVANTADIRQFQRMAFGSQDFSSEYSQSRSSIGSKRDF
ncbi:unnamed protein product [Urochloa humidicola]